MQFLVNQISDAHNLSTLTDARGMRWKESPSKQFADSLFFNAGGAGLRCVRWVGHTSVFRNGRTGVSVKASEGAFNIPMPCDRTLRRRRAKAAETQKSEVSPLHSEIACTTALAGIDHAMVKAVAGQQGQRMLVASADKKLLKFGLNTSKLDGTGQSDFGGPELTPAGRVDMKDSLA